MKTISDDSVDVVVVTLVLCSVRNVSAVMGEIRRILKPGGRFYYLEHVYSDQRNSWVQLAQRFLNPVWVLVCGCSLTRATWKDIDSGGFTRVNYKKFSAPISGGGALMSPHVMGYAVK
ncbi:thiol S-methyltransferase TMT1A-like [Ptychodera flava]|uniref:thiol S-methyltransferase TMT1A-like n=1 Tax=Ptychodera flava TaxID=63121 RepID=UPI00396A2DF3